MKFVINFFLYFFYSSNRIYVLYYNKLSRHFFFSVACTIYNCVLGYVRVYASVCVCIYVCYYACHSCFFSLPFLKYLAAAKMWACFACVLRTQWPTFCFCCCCRCMLHVAFACVCVCKCVLQCVASCWQPTHFQLSAQDAAIKIKCRILIAKLFCLVLVFILKNIIIIIKEISLCMKLLKETKH